ncbi:FadR/GntR family transcriptional regulator [Chelativorans sp. YIM 93263]|uniref:FadR/GntR family transcriptional regulator n=1 Tax=Chelativorans sp. YIM 93263 TaxID=2906648 RepID=UPI002379F01D|nr:FCD domain-containing protein [Chelativorans sp. YIM 93263]
MAEAIQTGAFLQGSRFPTERAIAEYTGLARNTVRDALSRLANRGLIVRHVGRGTFVSTLPQRQRKGSDRSDDANQWRGQQPSPRELVEFRSECEPALVPMIVMNASDDELDELEHLALKGRAAATWWACEAADAAFHAHLFAVTHNSVCFFIGDWLTQARRGQSWLALKQQTFSFQRWGSYQEEHETIVRHLKSRDINAARKVLRNHLSHVQGWVGG